MYFFVHKMCKKISLEKLKNKLFNTAKRGGYLFRDRIPFPATRKSRKSAFRDFTIARIAKKRRASRGCFSAAFARNARARAREFQKPCNACRTKASVNEFSRPERTSGEIVRNIREKCERNS